MDAQEFPIAFPDLNLTPDRVARAMGYPDGKAPDRVATLVDTVLAAAPDHAEVRAGHRIFPPEAVTLGPAGFRIDATTFQCGERVANQLQGLTSLALFTATAGKTFDAWSKGFFVAGYSVTGFVVDSLGSEIAEGAADWIEARIVEAAASRRWSCTNRYSPGYCGWPVQDQHALFSLLPREFCTLTLTDTALMVPMKSVSGVVGLGAGVEMLEYPCRICDAEDCFWRRE